jgi:hypothetical protein
VAGGIEFSVYSVQPNGPDLLIQLQRNDLILTTRLPVENEVAVDSTVFVTFLPDSINIFDAGEGALMRPDQSTVPIRAVSK